MKRTLINEKKKKINALFFCCSFFVAGEPETKGPTKHHLKFYFYFTSKIKEINNFKVIKKRPAILISSHKKPILNTTHSTNDSFKRKKH